MSNNSIKDIQALLNHYRKSSSQLIDLAPKIADMIGNGTRYSIQQLDEACELALQNTQIFLYWCSLLLVRLQSDAPVTNGNSINYLKYMLEFAKCASNYSDIILLEYSRPLNIEIAASDPTSLCNWAHELYQYSKYEPLRSPITHLVTRLKIESFIAMDAFLEGKNQSVLLQLLYMLLYLPYLSIEGQAHVEEIMNRILLMLVDINDLDGFKANIGQDYKLDIDFTTKVIDTMAELEKYYNDSNKELLTKIKSFLVSKQKKKEKKVKYSSEPLIVTVSNLHDIRYEPRAVYSHAFPNFSVSIMRGVTSDGLSIILKQYHSFSDNFDTSIISNEIDIMTYLSNNISIFKYVPRLYYTHIDNKQICIWMEDGGRSLIEYMADLKSRRMFIDKEILGRWIVELIECFALMNNHRINHCDIKPHNILVDERNMSLKVIDFNVSRITGEVQTTMSTTELTKIQGTEGYMAPELEQAHRDNLTETYYKAGKSDVFSLGLTILQMINLEKIVGYNMSEYNQILMDKVNKLNCDDWIKIMLKHMLNVDRKKRMSFSKLLQFVRRDEATNFI